MISSAANPKLKFARQVRDGRERGYLFVEGIRLAEDCVGSGLSVKLVMHSAEPNERTAQLLKQLSGTECYAVEDSLLKHLADTVNTQGIMLVTKRPEHSLSSVAQGDFILALDAVQDPGNLGTLLRSAEAAGVTGVILLHGCTDPFSPKALRSAMGSAFRLPVVTGVSEAELLQMAGVEQLALYSAALSDHALPYHHVDWEQRMCLVLGNEGSGVSASLQASSQRHVFIPMQGGVESLNVAAAGAILLFEVARQRGLAPI